MLLVVVVSVPVVVGLVNFNRPEAATRPASGGARPLIAARAGDAGEARGVSGGDLMWTGRGGARRTAHWHQPPARRCGEARGGRRGAARRGGRGQAAARHMQEGSPKRGKPKPRSGGARGSRARFFLSFFVDAYFIWVWVLAFLHRHYYCCRCWWRRPAVSLIVYFFIRFLILGGILFCRFF